jgi:hypothetical protein
MRARARVPKSLGWILVAALVLASVAQLEHTRHNGREFASAGNTVLGDLPVVVGLIGTPRAGEKDVLPPPVLALAWMLEKHEIDVYRYSDAIAKSPLISQRLVEAAWPRRQSDDAPFRLSYLADKYLGLPSPSECEEIDTLFVPDETLGVSLARCR